MKLTIGSRGSKLALAQTNYIKDLILSEYPDWDIDIKVIKTRGDKILDKTIGELGGKEIFIKEIESALLSGEIDMAVHSMKDMPGTLPKGLGLSFVPQREDPRDVLVMRDNWTLKSLPKNARLGTGSLRRKYQILEQRPDIELVPIRGNIETRIRKIEDEKLHGVVLAAAGIHRLELKPDHMVYLDLDTFLPSPGQGILGIEIREADTELNQCLMRFNDEVAAIQGKIERQYLKSVGGSCSVPVGAYLNVNNDDIVLHAMLGDDKGNLAKKTLQGKKDEDLGLRMGDLIKDELKQG